MAQIERERPPKAATEKEMLEAFLDYLRATLLIKAEGLSNEDLRRPMVPSGTGLPLQSRMGSVSTTTRLFACPATCMRRLHGSAATCCTTRRTSVPLTDVTNCAAPAFGADELLVQATPSRLVTLLEVPAPPTERLKFTGVGSRIRFWY